MFYLLCQSKEIRDNLIKYLRGNGIHAVFHYLSLHKSPFYKKNHGTRALPNCDKFSDTIVRLPFYFDLKLSEVSQIVKLISSWK